MRQLRHPPTKDITLPGVLAALADPVRLAVVAELAGGGERNWGEFEVGVSPSTLSHHMKVLREAGVINHRKEGTRCFVSLRADVERAFPGLLRLVLRYARSPATRRPQPRRTMGSSART